MAAVATARKLNAMVMNASSKTCDPPSRLTMSLIMLLPATVSPMVSTTLPKSAP